MTFDYNELKEKNLLEQFEITFDYNELKEKNLLEPFVLYKPDGTEIEAEFSNIRIDKSTVKDRYVYSLRHGDDDYISSLEDNVLVNHAGDIVTKEQIEFDNDSHFIDLSKDEDDSWGYSFL